MNDKRALNAGEIAQLIREMDLERSYVEQVYQSDYEHLVLRLKKAGIKKYLVINLGKASHIYWLSKYVDKSTKSLRFKDLLSSKLKNAVITKVIASNYERAIMFHVKRGEQSFKLVFLLWATAANGYLCTMDDKIIDAYYRKRGDIAQRQLERYHASMKNPHLQEVAASFALAADGTMNSAVVEYYQVNHQQISKSSATLEQQLENWQHKARIASQRAQQLHENIEQSTQTFFMQHFDDAGAYKQAWVNHQELLAQLRKKHDHIRAQNIAAQKQIEHIQALIKHTQQDGQQIVGPKQKHAWPYLSFRVENFVLLVGQNAKQNDLLLKYYSRGLDFWLHIHQSKGAFVLIKHRKEASPSSELILNACALAHYFSKKRYHHHVEVSYTQVKFLKKSKVSGEVFVQRAQILPYQYDKKRIQSLLQSLSQRSLENV